MEPFSSLAAVVQVLGNAVTAAVKVAQFINDIKHASETHDELQSRLGSMRRSLGHLATAIQGRKAQLGESEYKHHFRQEEQDILQEALDTEADCKRCAARLEEFSKHQNGSLMQRVKGQIVQGIKRPEIQRLESRIQTNVGTMQLLLLCLKTFVHDDQFEREQHLLDIRQQTGELKLLQDSFSNTLKRFVSESGHVEDIENSPRQMDWPLSEDERDLMHTTNRTLATADTLVDKLSRIGSEPSWASLDSDSLFGDDRIPIMIQVEASATSSTAVQWTPTPTDHLTLELMTSLLDEYIEQANQDQARGHLDECEKNLHSAIKWGGDRFHQHGQVFEQWFELQLRLAEVYQMQGKSTDAQNLILGLMHSSMENGPEYSKITSVRRAQLYYARANYCLDGYYKCHDITLSDLESIAKEAYIFVDRLKRNEVESYPGDTLSQLLASCAQIWSQVTEMQGEKVITKVLRDRHPKSNDPLSRPHSFQIQSGAETPARRRFSRGTYSTSLSGRSFTLGAPSETTPTEPSSSHSEISGGVIGRENNLTPELASIGDVEETDSAGLTPLLIAAKQRNWERMASLIKRLSANVNARDRDGMTALHHALRGLTCDEATIKLLLSREIDVNAADSNGDTALHYSVHFQHRKAARILLKSRKVDIDARNEKGQTAAALAASRGGTTNIPILELLISYGANLDPAIVPREMRTVVASLRARGGELARHESQSSNGHRSADPVRPSNASQRSGRSSRRWLPLSIR
ncbi:Elongation factor G [Talaromyces islandicus]|uniref:Elongation factor G n=1 Tax=Talaromyces islandicus TaxID=28573 RepID=A0A0U1LLH1_TALIS|nr:Elongation factor G [Talaromyces islandicus]